jgi:hypothetical protein
LGYPSALLGEETNALRRFSPRRNRWPELVKVDEKVAQVQERRTELQARAQEVSDRIQTAEVADREALAVWAVEEKGERPQPTVPAFEEERAALLRQLEALTVAETRILEEKAGFVERHREKLVRDADAETARRMARCEALIAELATEREELVEMRSTTLWAATYGTEAAAQTVSGATLCAGLAEPLRRILGLRQQLPAEGVFRVLREDVRVLRRLGTREQLEALGEPVRNTREARWENGQTDLVGPRFPATWAGSEEEKEQAAAQEAYSASLRRRLWGDD